MEQVLTYLGYILIVIGAIFLFLGGLGIVRLPDIYSRLQAGTKASTLGAMSLILGVGFLNPAWLVKSLVIVIFIALSNPISSHALARGSYRHNIKPWSKEDIDAYRQYLKEEGQKEREEEAKQTENKD